LKNPQLFVSLAYYEFNNYTSSSVSNKFWNVKMYLLMLEKVTSTL